jgi:hypothetical protein
LVDTSDKKKKKATQSASPQSEETEKATQADNTSKADDDTSLPSKKKPKKNVHARDTLEEYTKLYNRDCGEGHLDPEDEYVRAYFKWIETSETSEQG